MDLFYDTSAWVPLLLREEASEAMWKVKPGEGTIWAWSWLQAETEAALTRRKAAPEAWANWHLLRGELSLVDLRPDELRGLCAFNRAIGLRASDAGHLYVFERLFSQWPHLSFLTLDAEMANAARRIGLPLHPASAR